MACKTRLFRAASVAMGELVLARTEVSGNRE